MEETTTLIIGPTNMADIPTPHGWETAPTIGTGMGIEEIIKIAAATIPRSGLKEGVSFALLLISKSPFIIKGIAIRYHKVTHFRGRIPSLICIAKLVLGTRVNNPSHQRLKDIFCNKDFIFYLLVLLFSK
jgi:hypothetical protein